MQKNVTWTSRGNTDAWPTCTEASSLFVFSNQDGVIVRWIIGRLTAANWVAHVALILAAATVAAILATLPEGDALRKVVSTVLGVLAFMLIIQNLVERYPPGGRVSYGFPYAICAAASILMIVGQSMRTGPVVTGSAEISGLLFAIGIIMLAFQVRGLPRSA